MVYTVALHRSPARMLSEQAGVAGAFGAHTISSGMVASGGQSQRSTSDGGGGGGGGVPDQYAAEMARAAPQLRALRIDSEAPAAVGGPAGVRTRISPPDTQVFDLW